MICPRWKRERNEALAENEKLQAEIKALNLKVIKLQAWIESLER